MADTWPEDEDWDPPSPLDDPPESENENDSPRQYEGAPWYCQTHQTMHHRPAHIDGVDDRMPGTYGCSGRRAPATGTRPAQRDDSSAPLEDLGDGRVGEPTDLSDGPQC